MEDEDEKDEPSSKRQRLADLEQLDSQDAEYTPTEPPNVPPVSDTLDEDPTRPPSTSSPEENKESTEVRDAPEPTTYGPLRNTQRIHEPGDLTQALRRSLDLLDTGASNTMRGPFGRDRSPQEPDDEVLVCEDSDQNQMCDHHFESFLAQKVGNQEVKTQNMSDLEKWQAIEGRVKEWNKLLKAGAIRVYSGDEARRIIQEFGETSVLGSRFVNTRKEDPDNPDKITMKCRWVIKGFQDPDVASLHCQSPTLSADSLAATLQLIAATSGS